MAVNELHPAIKILETFFDKTPAENAGQRALVLCDELPDEFQSLQSRCPGLQHQTVKNFVSQYHTMAIERWPLIVVVDDQNEALALDGFLACIRDCAADRVLLWNDRASLSQLLALGFRRLEKTPDFFVFDLYDYKKRPDWFNADKFAHPHRWNAPE